MKLLLVMFGLLLFSSLSFFAQKNGESNLRHRNDTIYRPTQNPEALAFYNNGIEKSNSGDLNSAIQFYKKAIKLDPGYVDAIDNMAVCFRRLNQLDSAIYYYKVSLKIMPENAMARSNMGLAYNMKGDYKNALKAYTYLTKLYPENPEGFYGIAQTYLTSKKYKKAIEPAFQSFQMYQKKGDKLYASDAAYVLGLCYISLKEDEKGTKFFIKSAQLGNSAAQKLLKEYKIEY